MNDDFDALMARTDPTMVIVTTAAGEERSGCLVGFHCQCSIEPPRLAVWLSKANHTHLVGARADTFAVHWVPSGRHDLAELFGGATGDEVDKLARCGWTAGPDGVPVLDDCPDLVIGHRIAWLDVDTDHSCLVLEPIEARSGTETSGWLRLSDADDIEPGHAAQERQPPA
jgi:flavin reductase (DIM6/NTAB) family NADH-FMN oxidoreductase RutF